jgi:ligand-binding sensor domain-containing protein/signal transduction histidine kinase
MKHITSPRAIRIPEVSCIVLFLFFQSACHQSKNKGNTSHQLSVVEAKGYTTPADSLQPPKVIPVTAADFKVTTVGDIKSIPANTNIYAALAKKPLKVSTPTVCTPGKDSFLLPVMDEVNDTQITVAPREVVVAKDMAIKDPNPANFSFYSKLQGLRHPSVRALIQDKAGNIWIGMRGGGLSRFDGQNFTHFSNIPATNGHRVMTLIEDRSGNMWFGSEMEGLFKYDGQHFRYIRDKKKTPMGHVRTLLQDRKGAIWFGTTKGGVGRYNGKTFSIYSTKQGLSSNTVRHLIEDRQGNLWIATEKGVDKFDGKRFTHYTGQNGLPANGIRCLLEDKAGNIWMGTDSTGVIKYDGKQFFNFTQKEGLSHNTISTLLEDRAGNIWMGTDGAGAIKYDGKQFTHYGQKEGFPNREVICMLEDRSGNIWFGNYGSLTKLSGIPFAHFTDKEGLLFNQNWSILEDRKGNMWFGSQAGLCKYDGKQFTPYTSIKGLPSAQTVRSIAEDRQGNIWLGLGDGGGGFAKFDGKKFYYYKDPGSERGNAIQDIMEDRHGNLWMANYGSGVYKYDGKSITVFTTKQGLPSNITNSLTEDRNGNIWISTSDGGIAKYDGKQFTCYTTKDGLPHNSVWTSHEDKAGNIWFGTSEGAARYDGKYFTAFTLKEGLSEIYPLTLTEDHEGNMWFNTRNGLNILPKENARKSYLKTASNVSGIDKNLNLFKSFGYGDGFLGMGGQSGKTIVADRTGNIWACSNDRVTVYYTNREVKKIAPPKTRLTGISLFNEPVDWNTLINNPDTSIVLDNGVQVGDIQVDSTIKWQALPGGLSLPYDNNYLTFHFIGITMHQSDKVKYRYFLEGNDRNWSSLSGNNRASYSNLSPGNYTFKVKALSSIGEWSNEYVYTFTIRSPWWTAWWAYFIYAVLFASVLRAYIVFRSRQLLKKNQVLEHKVNIRTRELEQSINQLRATQSQLIQKEKLASLGELTAGIAHEIQNPLNFVNNFSEISVELAKELKAERLKIKKDRNEELENELVDDLIQNQEKINHHGKRASSIVKGMLEHSKASTGERELTDMNQLADEYLRLSYHGLRAKDSGFNSDYELVTDSNLPKIEVIPQDMGRVLLNLINNAFYAVNERAKQGNSDYQPKVTVSTSAKDNQLEIRVEDNGTGMSEATKAKIFQPFFTTKPTGEGTGLGLSLAYDIVTKGHGGTMEVESVEGEGTTFNIKLPI